MVRFIKTLAVCCAVTLAVAHASEMTGTTTVAKAYVKTKGSNTAISGSPVSAPATVGAPASNTVLLAPVVNGPPAPSSIITAPAPLSPSIADETSAQPTTVDIAPSVAMASTPIVPAAQLQPSGVLMPASPVAMMAPAPSTPATMTTPTGQAINAIASIDPSQGGRAKAHSEIKTTAGDAKIKVKAVAKSTPHGTVTKTKVKVRGELPPGTIVNAIANVGNSTVAKSSVGGSQYEPRI